MNHDLRVKLITHPSSVGRGIGFYSQHLSDSLSRQPGLILTDINPDLIHYTFFDLFYPTLKVPDLPCIVTIHDVTPLVLSDLYPKGLKGAFNLLRQKNALRKVSAVITDSNNSKEDIAKLLPVSKENIFVTPLAVDPQYSRTPSEEAIRKVKRKYKLPPNFLLYVGGVNPNKNLVRLIEATLSLNLPLVLVGSEFIRPLTPNRSLKAKLGLQKTHPELRHSLYIQELVAGTDLVTTLGFVPTEELNVIYRLATAYCQPSIYEGFGLPLLEAMTARCLIISSHTSSLPELYPKDTITFDPEDFGSLKFALEIALNLSPSARAKKIREAAKKAEKFTWEKTARLTKEVYQHVQNQ